VTTPVQEQRDRSPEAQAGRDPDSRAQVARDGDGAADGDNPQQGLGVLQLVSSVFAAGLGVQSSKNRERDFTQGRAGAFILAGLIFTALFIGTVYTVVSLVLSSR